MIVRLLGPVEVVGPGGHAVLSRRQRALVGVLALQAGTVVLPARVVNALWGDEPPRTAVKSLHSHVTRVRQALGACGLTDVLVTRGSGYRLAVDRSEIDACRFEDGLLAARAEAAAGRWAAAAAGLRDSLALWAGDPIQDCELAGWGQAEVTRLTEVRLTALEDLWDAELRLGHHAEAVRELEKLLVRYPLRERLVELAMLALYRSDRQLDALAAYQRLRERLAGELGVDPAPALSRLHTAILRHDPELAGTGGRQNGTDAPAARPAELPPRVGHFTGRAAELRSLDAALDADGDTRVAIIFGPGGMGKTALALQWAHRVRDRFPDGQVFLDLRGNDGESALTATEALTHVLRSLGVPGDQLPADEAALTGQFRSLLDGRRILVVLDNAATVEQIRPLVPATTTNALVVTSRRSMASLATYHAVHALRLDALSGGDAILLLRRVIGADRVDREATDAARIAARCGHMPLALRIAAAKLVGRPASTLRALAAELAGADRLDALSVEGEARSVRTVFASAYRALSPAAARMFRLLGLIPGPTFGRHLAAALAGLPLAAADRVLAELADAYLVVESEDARFRLHDLIRLYAAECARRAEDSRTEAVERLIDWYLGVAEVANRALDTGRDAVVPAVRHPLDAVPFTPDHEGTLAFLDGERENLLPVARLATEQGRHAAVWQLTYLLTGFFGSRGRWADRVEICRLGLAAAQRLGDPAAEGLMRSGLGVALVVTRRFDEALECLYPALEIARASGDRHREGHVANNIATAYARLRRFDEALEAYLRALAVHEANDDRLGVALARNNIGTAHVRLGRPDVALPHLDCALRLSRTIHNRRIEAGVLFSLGEAYLGRRDLDRALDRFRQALDIRRAIGDRRHEVDTLIGIGVTHLARGERALAVEVLRDALRLARDLADPHLISVSLTQLATAHLAGDEPETARDLLRRALALRARVPDPYEEARTHRALATLADRAGHLATAADHRERAALLFQKANAAAEAAELTDP